jgi:hypothetical protein
MTDGARLAASHSALREARRRAAGFSFA